MRPLALVAVFEVVVDAALQVGSQADVVQVVVAVQGIYAVPPADHFCDDLLVLVEYGTGDTLKVPEYKPAMLLNSFNFCHVFMTPNDTFQ